MSRIVRAAVTQTSNAFAGMPGRIDDVSLLAGRLDEIREANLDHHRDLIARAAELGAQVIGLGELFAAPYFALHEDRLWLDLAEDAFEGPTVNVMSAAAKDNGVVLIVPLYEHDTEAGKRYNTAVVIDETGKVLGRYRKNHIPCGANEQGSFHETFYYLPSSGELGNGMADVSSNEHFPVFRTSVGKIGVAICYDRHFEGVTRTLAAEGAELIFCPAVTFGEDSRRMWRAEFATDASRHGVYIAASNRCGREAPWNREFFGDSHFVGPRGIVPDVSDVARIVVADLDLDALSAPSTSGWDVAHDRRPDIYDR